MLNATVKPENVLVIDSAERIEASEFVVIRQLLQAILPNDGKETEGAWRVVIVTQTQSWVEGEETTTRRDGKRISSRSKSAQERCCEAGASAVSPPWVGWPRMTTPSRR